MRSENFVFVTAKSETILGYLKFVKLEIPITTVNWSMGPNLLSNLLDHQPFQEKLYQLNQYKLMENFLEETSQMRKLVFKHAAEIGCLLLPLSHFPPERPNVVCIKGLHSSNLMNWVVSLPRMNHFHPNNLVRKDQLNSKEDWVVLETVTNFNLYFVGPPFWVCFCF